MARDTGLAQRLVTSRNGELARRARAEGVEVVGVAWRLGLDPRAAWGLAREIATFAPRILHAHDSHALAVALAARALARAAAPPLVIATRRVDFAVGPRSPWRRTDHIIAISDAVRRVLVDSGVPADRISVVPSGIDPDEVRRAAAPEIHPRRTLGLAPDTPIAVTAGALVGHKDHQTLVRAAHHARATRPDLHWLVAGDGELRGALEQQINELGVGDRVHLMGYLQEVDPLIREANVFVMSSKEEGLGSVVLHALALGRPIVATRGGGLPEMLPAAALVDVGDAQALGDKVVATLAHPPSPYPLPPRFTAQAMAAGVVARYRALA